MDEKKVKKLFNIPTKKLEKAIDGIPWCKICNKKNIYLSFAIKSQHCNHLNHKKNVVKMSTSIAPVKNVYQRHFLLLELTLMNF